MTAAARAGTPGPWESRPTRSGKIWQVLTSDTNGPVICELRTNADDARLIAAAPSMATTLLWIRENLHPRALGRGATDAELIAITHATMVLREAGVIPTPDLSESEP